MFMFKHLKSSLQPTAVVSYWEIQTATEDFFGYFYAEVGWPPVIGASGFLSTLLFYESMSYLQRTEYGLYLPADLEETRSKAICLPQTNKPSTFTRGTGGSKDAGTCRGHDTSAFCTSSSTVLPCLIGSIGSQMQKINKSRAALF